MSISHLGFSALCLLLAGLFLISNETSTIAQDKQNKDASFYTHHTQNDTVDWSRLGGKTPAAGETDRAWPAQDMGLTGPIIASGGTGSNAYLMVFDPAGVLVGAVLKKDARKDPAKLNALIDLAYRRARIQNEWALRTIHRLKIAEQAKRLAAQPEEDKPAE